MVIHTYIEKILDPSLPLALRIRSHLLCGLVRIYQRKVLYLHEDAERARRDTIAMSSSRGPAGSGVASQGIAPGASLRDGVGRAVDLSSNELIANANAINLPHDRQIGAGIGSSRTGIDLENPASMLDSLALVSDLNGMEDPLASAALINFDAPSLRLDPAALRPLNESLAMLDSFIDDALLAANESFDGLSSSLHELQAARGATAAMVARHSAAFTEIEVGRDAHDSIAGVGGADFNQSIQQGMDLGMDELQGMPLGGEVLMGDQDMSMLHDIGDISMGLVNQSEILKAGPGPNVAVPAPSATALSSKLDKSIAPLNLQDVTSMVVEEDADTTAISNASSAARQAAALATRKRKQIEASTQRSDPVTELSSVTLSALINDPTPLLLPRRPIMGLPGPSIPPPSGPPSKRLKLSPPPGATIPVSSFPTTDPTTLLNSNRVLADQSYLQSLVAPAIAALSSLSRIHIAYDDEPEASSIPSTDVPDKKGLTTSVLAVEEVEVPGAGERALGGDLDSVIDGWADGMPMDISIAGFGLGEDGLAMDEDGHVPDVVGLEGEEREVEDAQLGTRPDETKGEGDKGVSLVVPPWLATKSVKSFASLLKAKASRESSSGGSQVGATADVDRRTAATAFVTLLHLLAHEKMTATQSSPYADIMVKQK